MPHSHASAIFIIKSSLLIFFLINAGGSAGRAIGCNPNDRETRNRPFCNASLPVHVRVRALIKQLTLPEKIRWLVNNAAEVPRLGIRRYEWWSEALHGVSNVGPGVKFGDIARATSFPQVILTAASFNCSLWEAIGQAVSDEARAMYNVGLAGLTYWSPNINIFRDPRWGRGQETPGEDPTLAGRYAVCYVNGLQGRYSRGDNSLKVAACCKHFTAYDLDNWNGTSRYRFNAVVSKQDLEDTFNPPFKACVTRGRVASVMCSYNQVNGKPTCADYDFLQNTIRQDWQLRGYIVSDCDSVKVLFEQQHYTRSPEEAAAETIKAGLDLDCGAFLAVHAESAIKKGHLKEDHVDGALTNTLTVQMRLHMYNGDSSSERKYGQLGPKDVCSEAHKQLAVEAARQGIVLLKNRDHALPLSRDSFKTVAVIGPNSDATVTMIGNYAGIPCHYVSPLEGIGKYAQKVISHRGCENVGCKQKNEELFKKAKNAAGVAQATILFMGLDQDQEREYLDRTTLLMPGFQKDLVTLVARKSRGPVILVLLCGGPLDVSFAVDDPSISAILWAGYPGQGGGEAIAGIIFGANSPGGKLPNTWYPQSYVANLPMTSMSMRPAGQYPGRTYRFYEGKSVFPFGHGLSYTRFRHSLARAPTTLSVPLLSRGLYAFNNSTAPPPNLVRLSRAGCDGLTLRVHVDVRNTGGMDGSETVLMYASPPRTAATEWLPIKQLVGFEKVRVVAGAQERVRMEVDVCEQLSVVDEQGIRRIPLGKHTLHIGDQIEHFLTLQTLLEQIKT